MEVQNGIKNVDSFLYLNVYIKIARGFVKNESEHFVDCSVKVSILADYGAAKREKSIRGAEPPVKI